MYLLHTKVLNMNHRSPKCHNKSQNNSDWSFSKVAEHINLPHNGRKYESVHCLIYGQLPQQKYLNPGVKIQVQNYNSIGKIYGNR